MFANLLTRIEMIFDSLARIYYLIQDGFDIIFYRKGKLFSAFISILLISLFWFLYYFNFTWIITPIFISTFAIGLLALILHVICKSMAKDTGTLRHDRYLKLFSVYASNISAVSLITVFTIIL